MSNSFVFITIAAGLCCIICQGWPQCCSHKSLVLLVQAVCNNTGVAMNGIFKDFVKKGDSELSEINLFGWMD